MDEGCVGLPLLSELYLTYKRVNNFTRSPRFITDSEQSMNQNIPIYEITSKTVTVYKMNRLLSSTFLHANFCISIREMGYFSQVQEVYN
jgi:hypothetical protein